MAGKIPSFIESEEDFESYEERLQCHFKVQKVENDMKVNVLISGLQASHYQILKNLLAPDKPSDKGYDAVVKVMKEHFGGKKNARLERARYRTVYREAGENVQDYAVKLKQASRYCEFGANLDSNLVDQFIVGVKSQAITEKILNAADGLDLTFANALQLAASAEATEKSAAVYNTKQDVQVNAVSGRTYKKDTRQKQFNHTAQKTQQKHSKRACYRCKGEDHLANKCRFITTECRKCHRIGHIAVACKNGQVPRGNAYAVEEDAPRQVQSGDNIGNHRYGNHRYGNQDADENQMYGTFHVEMQEMMSIGSADVCLTKGDHKYMITASVNEKEVDFQVDTGAVVTCVSEATYQKFKRSDDQLIKANLELRDYNKALLDVKGVAMVTVKYGSVIKQLPAVVVGGDRVSLIGRNWLRHIQLNWKEIAGRSADIHAVNDDTREKLFTKYGAVFQEELGCLKNFEVVLQIKSDAVPVYKRARTVPYHLKPLVESELQRLEEKGVIEPVTHAEWASPTVNIIKSDGKSVRICADFKETLNPVCTAERYPLPTPEDIFAKLAGGVIYSTLDLSHAYHQLKLSADTQKYMVINTHKGLYKFTRLQYGINTAVGVFQRAMENVIGNIPRVAVYIDDVVISSTSEEEHQATLELVLKKLNDAGLKLKKEKCKIGVAEVKYLGHRLTKNGITPLPEKVEAIQRFAAPLNKQELSTFCGMLKYYHRFIPKISDVMAPLYNLEKKATTWKWGEEEENAFTEAKSLLSKQSLLVYYNPEEPLFLTCDASAYGIGAVIEQKRNGVMQPVSFASRTLTGAEKNYSQTEKEGLAMVWGVCKFQKYLQGRKFEIWTDHKPLLGLLGEEKGVPAMASGRIIRWSILLASYNYTLKYVPGAKIPNADCLSRFPMKMEEYKVPDVGEEVLLLDHMDYTTMNADDIRRWTDRDPTLSRVRQAVLSGWRIDEDEQNIQPYYLRKDELSVLKGCVLWGSRVIVPPQGRDAITEELHATHPGIVKMKSLARAYLWWPNMDKDLERKVNTCKECQSVRVMRNTKQTLHPWEYPDRAWSRLHIDYAGPMEGRMFLVIVDAYSKWVEVIPTTGCTSKITVRNLTQVFTTHGLPDAVVSDNGAAFVSEEFKEFMNCNGIRHVRSAPFHPATNGLAENAVKSFKRAVKKDTGQSLEAKLQQYLFTQRITPHSTTGVPPCELLMKRRLKSKFDLLHPSIGDFVRKKQEKQVQNFGGRDRNYSVGDHVYFKNFAARGPPNISGVIEERTGPVSCCVRSEAGIPVRKHFDQLYKQERPEDKTGEFQEEEDTERQLPTTITISNKGPAKMKIGHENPTSEIQEPNGGTSMPVNGGTSTPATLFRALD